MKERMSLDQSRFSEQFQQLVTDVGRHHDVRRRVITVDDMLTEPRRWVREKLVGLVDIGLVGWIKVWLAMKKTLVDVVMKM